MIHHRDCTWCLNRSGIVVMDGKKKREKEVCAMGHVVPAPFSGSPRYCIEYVQKGCTECEAGNVGHYDLRVKEEYDKLRAFEETAQ